MSKESLLEAFANSIPDPVVIADTQHKVIFINKAAREHFENGDNLLGRSLMECHNADSKHKMEEVLAILSQGEEDEVQITDKPGQRTFMRAVKNSRGNLLGYYERYMYWPKRID